MCGFSVSLILEEINDFLLNKKVSFDINEMQSKKENPTHIFRERNLAFQLI